MKYYDNLLLLERNKYIFYSSIYLLPLWWVLGFDFFIYHLFALYLFLKSPKSYLPSDKDDLFIIMLVFSLLLGCVISILILSYEGSRYIAALNNASIVFLIYIYYKSAVIFSCFGSRELPIYKVFFYISVVYLILSFFLGYFIISGSFPLIEIPTLIGLVFPNAPGLLGEYQSVTFVSSNWFLGDTQPRLFILAPFATGTAVLGCISAYLGAVYLVKRNFPLHYVFVFLLAMFIGVSFTLSRATTIGYLGGMIILLTLLVNKRILFVFAPVFFIIIFVFFYYYIDELILFVMESRQGSSDTRIFSYILSYDIVMNINPITGLGVKPRFDDMYIPVGSHSTFIGSLVRGGVIAFGFAIIVFFILPLYKFLSVYFTKLNSDLESKLVISCLPCCLLFFIFQDVDAYPVIAVMIALYMAALKRVYTRSLAM